jgi:hypothetical protein
MKKFHALRRGLGPVENSVVISRRKLGSTLFNTQWVQLRIASPILPALQRIFCKV